MLNSEDVNTHWPTLWHQVCAVWVVVLSSRCPGLPPHSPSIGVVCFCSSPSRVKRELSAADSVWGHGARRRRRVRTHWLTDRPTSGVLTESNLSGVSGRNVKPESYKSKKRGSLCGLWRSSGSKCLDPHWSTGVPVARRSMPVKSLEWTGLPAEGIITDADRNWTDNALPDRIVTRVGKGLGE